MKYYCQDKATVLGALNSTDSGLKAEEASRRLEQNGKNKLVEGKKKSIVRRFLEQLADPMIIILIVARCYLRFKQSKLVSGAMFALRATVVGLMAGALWGMLPTVFFHSAKISWENVLKPEFLCSAGIFGVMLVAALKKVSPIILIVCSAVLGIACGLVFGVGC